MGACGEGAHGEGRVDGHADRRGLCHDPHDGRGGGRRSNQDYVLQGAR